MYEYKTWLKSCFLLLDTRMHINIIRYIVSNKTNSTTRGAYWDEETFCVDLK